MKIVSIFNNKGGVGKTTYMFHVAHLIAEHGKTVLMVDADAQCNLSAYCLTDTELEKAWNVSRGNSIWRAIEDVYKGIGDIRKRQPTKGRCEQVPDMRSCLSSGAMKKGSS
ncbi:ParA family protein [Aeromonas caviae]|nr:ParA family protein [Aeromonas caviae]